MENNQKYKSITKKLRIAYKRWLKRCESEKWDGFSEPHMASGVFMLMISQYRQKLPDKNFDELIKLVQREADDEFNKQQEREFQTVRNFIEAHKLSEKEAKELINKTEAKINSDRSAYNDAKYFNLKLFDYSIDDIGEPYEDFYESFELIKKLDELGYYAVLIDEIKIVYEKNKSIGSLAPKYIDLGYDIVTSGTFFGVKPYGTIITSDKEMHVTSADKVSGRGGIAVLSTGLVSYGLTKSNAIDSILSLFEEEIKFNEVAFAEIIDKDSVKEFMGGGGLLIKDSRKISGKEILDIQKFDQSPEKDEDGTYKKVTDGLNAEQFRRAYHLVLGKKNELDYLILSKHGIEKTGREIQNDLFELGFEAAIKFDGGSGYFVESSSYKAGDKGKNNKSGFAIKVVKS